jgi:hypothetical protein
MVVSAFEENVLPVSSTDDPQHFGEGRFKTPAGCLNILGVSFSIVQGKVIVTSHARSFNVEFKWAGQRPGLITMYGAYWVWVFSHVSAKGLASKFKKPKIA